MAIKQHLLIHCFLFFLFLLSLFYVLKHTRKIFYEIHDLVNKLSKPPKIFVIHIGKLQDFTLDFYFRQFWTDPRLAYRKRPGVETLSVGSEFIKNIWVPDTFFVNEKQSYFHIATTSNEFIRVHHSGSITRSIR